MAIKGLSIPAFADYHYDGNTVKYTNGFICGSAIEYGAEIETSEDNPLYGDDKIIEHDYGTFSTGTLTLNTSDLTQKDSKRLLNLKEIQRMIGDTSVTELVYDDDAKSASKGFGVIETHQINDEDRYRAVILCKVTPKNPSEAATTKGESIEWQTKEMEASIERSDEENENYKHPWKYEAWFKTHAEALEYLKTVLNVLETLDVTYTKGATGGKVKLTVKPASSSGNSYKYKVTDTAPTYKEDLTSWEDWDGQEELSAQKGNVLYVAEVNQEKKAVKAGSVEITTDISMMAASLKKGE